MFKKTIATLSVVIALMATGIAIPVSAANSIMYVTANNVNVRTGPGTGYTSIGRVNKGTPVQALSNSNGWQAVSINGQTFYIASQYLGTNNAVATTPTAALVTATYADIVATAKSADPNFSEYLEPVYDGHSTEELANLILATFGTATSSDPFQTIRDTYSRVAAKMCYDSNFLSQTTYTAVSAGRGVCSHYDVIAYMLLNAEGIPTRITGGLSPSGGYHAWNECYVGGAWYKVDFTEPLNGGLSLWAPYGIVRAEYAPLYIEFKNGIDPRK